MRYNLQNFPSKSDIPPEERQRWRDALRDALDPGWREREQRFREVMSRFDYAGLELRVLASQGHQPKG